MEHLIPIGFLIVVIGIMIILVGLIGTKSKRVEGGFIAFIGPIPIMGATSKNMLYFVVMVSVVLFVLFLILNKWLVI